MRLWTTGCCVVAVMALCCGRAAVCRGESTNVSLFSVVDEDSTGTALVGSRGERVRAEREPAAAGLTLVLAMADGEHDRVQVGGAGYQSVMGGVLIREGDEWTCCVTIGMLGAKDPVRMVVFGRRGDSAEIRSQIFGFGDIQYRECPGGAIAVVRDKHEVYDMRPLCGATSLFYEEAVYRLGLRECRLVGRRLGPEPASVLARFAAANGQAADQGELFLGENEDAISAIKECSEYDVRMNGSYVTYTLQGRAGTRQLRFHEIVPRIWTLQLSQ